jgi:hypothetical protein
MPMRQVVARVLPGGGSPPATQTRAHAGPHRTSPQPRQTRHRCHQRLARIEPGSGPDRARIEPGSSPPEAGPDRGHLRIA